MNGLTDERVDRRMSWLQDEWTAGRVDCWTNGLLDELTAGCVD